MGCEGIAMSEQYLYSNNMIMTYDKERHIPVDDAFELIKAQNNDKLSLDKLISAIDSKDIKVYEFKNDKYLDRLDIGRIYENKPTQKEGLTIERFFTDGKTNPYETVGKYIPRTVEIKDVDGKPIFYMNDAVFPESWSQNDTNIVAQKYFFKPLKQEWRDKIKEKIGKEYEYSITNVVERVTNFIANNGEKFGYFKTSEDKQAFADELKWLQINRRLAFNSPVQFNAGLYNEYDIEGSPGINFWRNPETGKVTEIEEGSYVRPQSHACFIKGPRDDLKSIGKHVMDEASIFSSGSGVGQDIGKLRGNGERLSSGGKSSGSLSFLKIYDDTGGTIKSGGKSRRAARMTTMRQDHRDIMDFIRHKVKEDHKALILMQAGIEGGMDGEAYNTVTSQNTNFSVRLDDNFFEQIKNDGYIELRNVNDNEVVNKVKARRMLQEISFGSWRIGDPAVQYESKIQEMHTAKNSGRQNSSNPCSEYMFLDDTACNLASQNLLAYSDTNGNFDVQAFKRGNKIASIALDIINDASSYPVKDIAITSPEFRNIGLGYANLGALLMRKGLTYDSEEGRNYAAALTSILTGSVYEQSTELAKDLGTFVHYEFNKKPMLEVIEKHANSLDNINWNGISDDIRREAYNTWSKVLNQGKQHGFRNAQVTLLAPTGTISYLMGCDTTGVEPSYSLQIFKQLAGGGWMKIVNNEVPNALINLGYSKEEVSDISKYVEDRNTVIGAPYLDPKHYRIFETAAGNKDGLGAMGFEGHVRMLAATQPFISGAISKTNNLPESATVADIYNAYILGHELGLKAVSVFRNNSKPISALTFGGKNYKKLVRGEKEDLPTERQAYEVEFNISGTQIHVLTSEYTDGRPGQIAFLAFDQGSTLASLLTIAGIQASKSLKRGVDLEDTISAWKGHKAEPHGIMWGHKYVKDAASILDAAYKMLMLEYKGRIDLANDPSQVDRTQLRGFKNGAFETYERMNIDDWDIDQVLNDHKLGGFNTSGEAAYASVSADKDEKKFKSIAGVVCHKCGNAMMQTAPNCFSCTNCGDKIGGCGL
jgi:ribonucleoside-diphosphate reductase alpha chain